MFSVASREVTRLAALEPSVPDLDALLAGHVRSRIAAWSGAAACEPVSAPRSLVARPGFQRLELRLRCPPGPGLRIRIAALFEVAPAHVHFARVRSADGERTAEYLFSAGRPEIELASPGGAVQPGGGTSFAGWVRLGVDHIAGGIDHLAFLLALLLLCRSLRQVIWIATGFTLGHSLTLALAVLGWLRPDPGMIEAGIGFTIALVAAESAGERAGISRRLGIAIALALAGLAAHSALSGRAPAALGLAGLALFSACYLALVESAQRARLIRPAVTLAFGLVHGFGFAGQLLSIGVPSDRLLSALLGFNLGVELGQLASVTAVWSSAALVLARWPGFPRCLALDLSSAALCGVGLYWFVSRAWA